jgi:hypothetical protein
MSLVSLTRFGSADTSQPWHYKPKTRNGMGLVSHG